MKRVAAALLAALAIGIPAAAQEREEIKSSTENLKAERKALVKANLDLTEEESRNFWPLYQKYHGELDVVDDQRVNLIGQFASNYEALSEEKALAMVHEFFDFKAAKIELQSAYIDKFAAVLPGTKVMRYYQIEHLIDLNTDLDLLKAIPLVK